jgi:dihydrofolate reductase
VTVIDGDPQQIAQLRDDGEGDVLVQGSPTLVRWLLANALLDELNVTVLPIVVGEGARLFDDMPTRRLPLRLTRSAALRSGVLELQYVPDTSQD